MADTNFSRASGASTGWLIGGGLILFLVLVVALAFSGPGGAPNADGTTPAPAIETAPAAPVTPTE